MTSVAVTFISALIGVMMIFVILCGAAVIASGGAVGGVLGAVQDRIARRYGGASGPVSAPSGPATASLIRLVTVLTGAAWVFAGLAGLFCVVAVRQAIR